MPEYNFKLLELIAHLRYLNSILHSDIQREENEIIMLENVVETFQVTTNIFKAYRKMEIKKSIGSRNGSQDSYSNIYKIHYENPSLEDLSRNKKILFNCNSSSSISLRKPAPIRNLSGSPTHIRLRKEDNSYNREEKKIYNLSGGVIPLGSIPLSRNQSKKSRNESIHPDLHKQSKKMGLLERIIKKKEFSQNQIHTYNGVHVTQHSPNVSGRRQKEYCTNDRLGFFSSRGSLGKINKKKTQNKILNNTTSAAYLLKNLVMDKLKN